jgi:hypothetical protein
MLRTFPGFPWDAGVQDQVCRDLVLLQALCRDEGAAGGGPLGGGDPIDRIDLIDGVENAVNKVNKVNEVNKVNTVPTSSPIDKNFVRADGRAGRGIPGLPRYGESVGIRGMA